MDSSSISRASSSGSDSRAMRIPSPPPPLFPLNSRSPLAPLINSNPNALIELNTGITRSAPLPAPVFLDLNTEVNRSVTTMPSLHSSDRSFAAGSSMPSYQQSKSHDILATAASYQKSAISKGTDLFGASPLYHESVVDAPAVPDYFDRMTSFYSTLSSCTEVLDALSNLMENNWVDHRMKGTKKQIKCIAYVNEHPVQFRIHVFYVAPSKYMVEFQKRDGCCFAYRQLYKGLLRQMSHQLCDEEVVKDATSNAAHSTVPAYSGSLSMAPLSLKDSRQETFSACSGKLPGKQMALSFLDSDSVNLLLTMAQADCMQSQREALRALCCSSAHDGEQACTAVNTSTAHLTALFQTLNGIVLVPGESAQDEETVRCALTFLNNLLDKKSDAAHAIRASLFGGALMDPSRLITKALNLLDEPSHLREDELTMVEIKRQCARLLATLASFNGADVKPMLDASAMATIDRYENCEDKRLQTHIQAARTALMAK